MWSDAAWWGLGPRSLLERLALGWRTGCKCGATLLSGQVAPPLGAPSSLVLVDLDVEDCSYAVLPGQYTADRGEGCFAEIGKPIFNVT